MNKVLVVARNEFMIAITSKAFLVGVLLMPVFMGGAIGVQFLTKDQVDLEPRKIAIVDKTDRLLETLIKRSETRNLSGIYREKEEPKVQIEPKFEVVDAGLSDTEEGQAEALLSDRVREGDLFAFAVIEPNAFEIGAIDSIRYYSQSPSYQRLPNWIRNSINEEVITTRINDLQLDPKSVAAVTQTIPLRQFGLVEMLDGVQADAKEENRALVFGVPFAGLMLMFMMVMSVAPAMLNNVLEEKIQKISEFLVSSVTPFQLMLGKLIGSISIGLIMSSLYLSAIYFLARHYEFADAVPPSIYAWFMFFMLIALIIFGSLFSAIGAACSEIRDAQSLMTPVMLMVVIPMMCLAPVMDSPNSFFAKVISLFPPATPMMMFVRIAIPPGPAAWEIILGTTLVVAFAIMCVWASGKIFRIGILSQGQTPSFAQLFRWLISKA
ncbi:MAG: ABC transporter permease [Planctomycetota bacterium]